MRFKLWRVAAAAALTCLGLVLLASVAFGAKAQTGLAPISVGIVAPQDTVDFNLNYEVAAVRARVLAINRAGGLAHHKVNLIYCNDKGDPNQTAVCARQMIADHVIGVFGGALLGGGTVLTPTLAAAGIPQIGLIAISPPEFSSPNVYLFGGGGNQSFPVIMAYAKYLGLKEAIAYENIPQGSALVPIWSQQSGVTPVAQVPVSLTQADFAPIVASIKSSGAGAVIMSLSQTGDLQLMAAAAAEGQKFTWLTPVMFTPADYPNLGGAAAGKTTLDESITAQQFPPLTSTNPLIKQFVSEVHQERAIGDGNAVIGAPGGLSSTLSTGWLGLWVVQKMAQSGLLKTFTAAGLKAALNKLHNFNMDGVMPPWTPNAVGPTGLVRAPNESFFIIRWKNGKPYAIDAKPVTVAQVRAGAVKKVF
jgi:ABC-type branched-subunit amino acid transport system substrate-binding protein